MVEREIVEKENILNVWQLLQHRREEHRRALWDEVDRLTTAASKLGVRQIVLFGSLLRGEPGLTSDLDLLIVWDTPLDFLERTVELYRRLQPRVATDFLVYTPKEMEQMKNTPLVRRALDEGRVLYEA
jgi:predicted nucleotidyltransferase